MSAPVRIEARAWGDIRFATLARLLGLADSDHALIKVARLWSWQTEHFTADEPTYVLDADTIESVLGPGGPAALVRARLATEVTGGYRLHGTEGQIEWCGDLSSTRQQAGRARAAGARRDARGRLLPRDNGERDHESPAGSPANVQQPSSGSPAQSSAPSPSPSPDPEDQTLPPARDPAVPSPEPAPPTTPPPGPSVPATSRPAPAHEDAARTRPVAGDHIEASKPTAPLTVTETCVDRQADRRDRDLAPSAANPAPMLPSSVARADARRHVIATAWQLAGQAFRELGRDGIERTAPDPWAGLPGADDEGMKLLLKQVDRLLVGDPPDVERALEVFQRRIAVAKAEGRVADPPTRRWLTPMRLWNPESFAKGAEMSPEQVRPRQPRAAATEPAKPSKPRRPDPPPKPIAPADRANPADFAAARAALGFEPAASLDTPALVELYGDDARAPPASTGPTDPDPDQQPRRRKAAT